MCLCTDQCVKRTETVLSHIAYYYARQVVETHRIFLIMLPFWKMSMVVRWVVPSFRLFLTISSVRSFSVPGKIGDDEGQCELSFATIDAFWHIDKNKRILIIAGCCCWRCCHSHFGLEEFPYFLNILKLVRTYSMAIFEILLNIIVCIWCAFVVYDNCTLYRFVWKLPKSSWIFMAFWRLFRFKISSLYFHVEYEFQWKCRLNRSF